MSITPTFDSVTINGTLSGGSVTASGTTTSRAIAARFADIVNVKDFGAIGDGVTDNTAAFQAAAAAVPASGGTLLVPPGVYIVRGTTLLKSYTTFSGYGATLLADALWPGGTTYQFVLNANYLATTITDQNITIEGLTFDYGTFPAGQPPAAARGATHCVGMWFARQVLVKNCVFQVRAQNNATAMVGCNTTMVTGCFAYDMRNCAYDHWWGPANGSVIGCYAQTDHTGQMINWNAESGLGDSGLVADGFILSNNTLVCTGTTAAPMQLEPLSSICSAQNIVVSGNVFRNCRLLCRRNVRGMTISHNTFIAVLGGGAVVNISDGGTGLIPVDAVITGNNIIDPATSSGDVGVLRIWTDSANIIGNRISGTTYGTVSGIETSAFQPIVAGNYVSNGQQNTGQSRITNRGLRVNNNFEMGWFDTTNNVVTLKVQNDNNLIWSGTNASGNPRNLIACQQQSSSSAFQIWPTTELGRSGANYVRAVGVATGSAPQLLAVGADTDIPLELLGQGADGVKFAPFTSSVAPTGTTLPSGRAALWKNTGDGTVKLYYNDGGSLKSVALA